MTYVFYVTVKVVCSFYLLYRLFVLLVRYEMFGLWERVFVTKSDHIDVSGVGSEHSIDILGKTTSVYLDDPSTVTIMSVRSEMLERADIIFEEDADISADEVEETLARTEKPILPDDSELYDEIPIVSDNEFSQGMTFDQISNAVAVIANGTFDGDNASEAARTLYEIRNTDMFGFFTTQVANAEAVDNLFRKYIDTNGYALIQQSLTSSSPELLNFDWDKYV